MNRRQTQMDADYSYKEETDLIIGSAFAVLIEAGHDGDQKPDENDLAVEFGFRQIPFPGLPLHSLLLSPSICG